MAASSCDLDMLKNYNSHDLWGHLMLGDLEFLRMLNSCGIVYLLDYSLPCIKCGGTMNFRDKSGKLSFRCTKASCLSERGYFVGTFLENANLTPKEIWQIGYYFVCSTHTQDEYLFDMRQSDDSHPSSKTIVDWKNFYRDVSCEYFIQHLVEAGSSLDDGFSGESSEVQKDKKCFLIECSCSKDCPEPNSEKCCQGKRDAATLLQLLENFVLPRTLIMSDKLAAYGGISKMQQDYGHLSVNHSENFVDPYSGAHTQGIESNWSHFKKRFVKQTNGIQCDMLQEYISEFMWRKLYSGDDAFFNLWKQIVEFYPLE